MQSPRQPSLSTPLNPPSHYQPLVNGLPRWLADATPARREALKNNRRPLTAQIKTAPQARHAELRTTIAEHMKAQTSVDETLAHLQDINAYAEPLLKAALKSKFALDLDVKETFLRLYIPVSSGFSIQPASRTWTVSLLEAALHNFEEKETREDAYNSGSGFITRPSASGQFEPLPQVGAKISIAEFTHLCRELDIGASYKTFLESNLGITDATVAATLKPKIRDSQKAAFRAALQLARMNGDIAEDWFLMTDAMLDGVTGMRVENQALQFQDLKMMSADLTGIVIVAPDLEAARTSKSLVVYVPDDPEHPVKQYASSADMETELTRQLRSTDYQHFFSRFILHEQRGHFFAQLNNRLSQVQWHAPQPGSQEPAWRETPLERPNLQLTVAPIAGELWQHLYQSKLNKILNDAAAIAVSTATVDRNARWALWDSFVNIASSILQIASFVILPFVPFLGEMMMAYMAYQMLDEVFEGVIDWAEGLGREATEHLFGALESLIQLGAFAVGGGIAMAEAPKVLPASVVSFIDRFKPVKLRNGKTLYWKPDLEPYRRRVGPPVESVPDSQGLHLHQGKKLMKIDQAHYEVSDHEQPGKLYIEHPTRPDAYRPTVRHNGDGAFHTELEHPLEWDTATVLQRLSPGMESFSPEQRARILKVSGYDEDALRAMHVNQERMPPLLADTVQRFRLDQQLQDFITRMASDKPGDYLEADPLTQLQLLNDQGLWPVTRRLRLIDRQDRVIWESSTDAALPPTEIRQDRLTDNDLLTTVLQQLSEAEINRLPGAEFAQRFPLHVRAGTLRSRLAQIAKEQRGTLFEQRYQALQQRDDPQLKKVAAHVPHLPARVSEELLGTASGAQLLDIHAGSWPEHQQALSQEATHALRITRAYEGLELDSVHNPDTDTLALHSLKRLPGWSADVNLEIRNLSFTGPALDSTGRANAPIRKILVRKADGSWQPYDEFGKDLYAPTDFYTCVLQALPDNERQALNLQIGEGPKLKQAIRDNPHPRSELRLMLVPEQPPAPPADTLRLLGMDGHPQIAPQDLGTIRALIRNLYPRVSVEEILTMTRRLESHPNGVFAGLQRLQQEYARLEDDLAQWTAVIPRLNPLDGTPLSNRGRFAAKRNRQMFANQLKRCWRRETYGRLGYEMVFDEPIAGALPTLTADFGHVANLEINGSDGSAAVNAFLEHFQGLRKLDLRNCALRDLPPRLPQLAQLKQLRLRNCGITLTPENRQVLSLLNELSALDLQDNPLGQVPDLNFMPRLSHLNLSRTGISEVPPGLFNLHHLSTLRLGNNQITTLSDELFSLPADATRDFNFFGNPLSNATRERVKTYFQETGNKMGIRAPQPDIDRTRALFTNLDDHASSELLYEIPGSLLQGQLQLGRWENELSQLTTGLTQWAQDIPVNHPTTGEALTAPERSRESSARNAFAYSIERLWRYRSPEAPGFRAEIFKSNVTFIGDMPALNADFRHITELSLSGSKHTRATSRFLTSFPRLRKLSMNNFVPDPLPPILTNLPMLGHLTLIDCGVTWTDELQTALASLDRLISLKLSRNPLGRAPDVSQLRLLDVLDISHTSISEVPAGISDHPSLREVQASNNEISELPQAFFEMPAEASIDFDFSRNPLSLATHEKIKHYARETSNDFGVLASVADIEDTQRLFPDLDPDEASDLFYSLPGDLEHSRVQLRHWSAELRQLVSDLDRWTQSVRETGMAGGRLLTPQELTNEHSARETFASYLKILWRTRSKDDLRERIDSLSAHLTLIGPMPEITTVFEHIQNLSLSASASQMDIAPFVSTFTSLRRLKLKGFRLDENPLTSLPLSSLEELELTDCALTLTPQSRATLSSLVRLKQLNLSRNPLGAIPPTLETLPALTRLRMSDTLITAVPDGLLGHPLLEVAYLERNQINDIPDTFFEDSARLPDMLSFADNALSTATRERIKRHYPRRLQDFGVLMPRADIDRVTELFPTLQTQDANRVLYLLPGSIEEGRLQISRWEAELQQLDTELEHWTKDVPTHHPQSGVALSEIERATEIAKRMKSQLEIEILWRKRSQHLPESRATSLKLDASFIGDLPTLSANFSHVTTLNIKGNPDLSVGESFLNSFTGLQTLELRDAPLTKVPKALSRMPDLQMLVMSDCAISLDDEGARILWSRTQMVRLDLYRNPLGRLPDLRNMPALQFLDLGETGIDNLPLGLLELPELSTAILSGNRISELPVALFDLPASVTENIDLSNNPLSAKSRDRIKTYYRDTGENFGVQAEPTDIATVKSLYPDLSDVQANILIYHLNGTLTEGRLELARREAEIGRMRDALEIWENSLPQELTDREREQESTNRERFKQALVASWRTGSFKSHEIFTFKLPIRGQLPAMGIELHHVTGIDLRGADGLSIHTGQFLETFPNLDWLDIRNYNLARIPEAIFRMPRLQNLSLPACNITLSPSDVAGLAGLDSLDLLHLQNNPLGLTPDLSNLHQLRDLDLSYTGIHEIPNGVLENHTWLDIDLSHNQIREIPELLSEVPAYVGDRYDLRGNLFSPAAMERIRAYYHATGETLNVEGVGNQPPGIDIEMEP